jgi:N-acetylmuramoyl-L-alanine amidase
LAEAETARRERGLARWAAALLLLAGAAPAAGAPDRFDTVVVDAGHGGEDSGARGSGGLEEKQLVLDVARRLAAALRGDDLRVVMTRNDDTFVPLEARTWVANDAHADLFVSIHANAAPDTEVRGTETYFLSVEASDESAQRVAERENAAFGAAGKLPISANDSFLALMGDLITGDYARDSDEFAKLVQHELAATDRRARGVKQAPFVVLANVQMPAALVEIGFLTNPADEHQLASAEGRERVVQALARAIREFGRRYDQRHGAERPAAAEGAP